MICSLQLKREFHVAVCIINIETKNVSNNKLIEADWSSG